MRIITFTGIFVFLLLLFNSCSDDVRYVDLDRIYKILEDENSDVDSVAVEFRKIDNSDVRSERSKSLYNFIDVLIRYRRNEYQRNDSVLDMSIRYFKKADSKRLARAYLLKGKILYSMGKVSEAVESLKECERLIEKYNFIDLKYRFYGYMGMVNEQADEYSTAMEYTRKNMYLSMKTGNKKWLADAYNSMAVDYNGLGMMDSANYYIRKCPPLLRYVSDDEKVIILNNLSYFTIETDIDYSIKCLEEALKLKPNAHTYTNLAYIYSETGKPDKADSLWAEGLKTADLKVRIKTMETLIPYRRKQGRNVVADSLVKILIHLKDSQINNLQTQRVKEMQIGFDYRLERQRLETQRLYLGIAVIVLVIVAGSVVYIYKYRSLIAKNEILQSNMQVKLCQQTIRELEIGRQTDRHTIEGQSNTINAIRCQQEEYLEHGRKLFLAIKSGGTTALWSKNDFVVFTDYYATIDAVFTLKLNTDYKNLSARYKTFLILEHEGFSTDEVARILSISTSSLRTIRHRVNAAKLN